MGLNQWSAARTHGRSQYRENTLKSFLEAVRCGATFIEFDVQTTADGVPVIWHDNYIVSSSASKPGWGLVGWALWCWAAGQSSLQARVAAR